MRVVLFPIRQRDPKWDTCFVCKGQSDHIASIKRSAEDAEVNSPICNTCASQFFPNADRV